MSPASVQRSVQSEGCTSEVYSVKLVIYWVILYTVVVVLVVVVLVLVSVVVLVLLMSS